MKSTSIYCRKPCLQIFSVKTILSSRTEWTIKLYNYDSKLNETSKNYLYLKWIANNITTRSNPATNGHIGGDFFSVVSSVALSSTLDLAKSSRKWSRELRDERESRSMESESMSDFCDTLMRSRNSFCCMR